MDAREIIDLDAPAPAPPTAGAAAEAPRASAPGGMLPERPATEAPRPGARSGRGRHVHPPRRRRRRRRRPRRRLSAACAALGACLPLPGGDGACRLAARRGVSQWPGAAAELVGPGGFGTVYGWAGGLTAQSLLLKY